MRLFTTPYTGVLKNSVVRMGWKESCHDIIVMSGVPQAGWEEHTWWIEAAIGIYIEPL